MQCSRLFGRKVVTVVTAVAIALQSVTPVVAKSAVKMTKWSGMIDFSGEGPAQFSLEGNASHLGQFTAYGEVVFEPGEEEGTLVGDGVIVFKAANGDQLVGVATWYFDDFDGQGSIQHISWRDSIQLSDGTHIFSTGRFENDRPPGIVTIEYLVLGTFLALALIVGVSA